MDEEKHQTLTANVNGSALDRILQEWHQQPISFTGAILALVTTGSNFVYSLPTLIENVPSPSGLDTSLILRLVLFVFLEGSLAYAFGVILVKLGEAGRGFPFILTIVSVLVSAWVSGFNAFWLFVANLNDVGSGIGALITAMIFAFIIAWYFIYHHFDLRHQAAKEIARLKGSSSSWGGSTIAEIKLYVSGFHVAFWSQLAAFIFVTIHLAVKVQPYLQAQ